MTVPDEFAEVIPALRTYAWALTRQSGDVDALVQDTLLTAMDHIEGFPRELNLRAWLMTIMRQIYFDKIAVPNRPRSVTPDGKGPAFALPALEVGPTRAARVMEAVAQLPLHDRETLVVVVMLGESSDTAAELFGVPVDCIEQRVRRSRAKIIADLRHARGEPSDHDDAQRRGGHRPPRMPGSQNPALRGSRRSS